MICNEQVCDAIVCVPAWILVMIFGFCFGCLFCILFMVKKKENPKREVRDGLE